MSNYIHSYAIWESLNSNKKSPIILIGPQGSGKSTTAKALAKKLKVPLISSDMMMVDPKFENLCKNKPGVEVEIKRHPTEGIHYDSNEKYVLCVLTSLLKKYEGKRVVLDIGGSHAYKIGRAHV